MEYYNDEVKWAKPPALTPQERHAQIAAQLREHPNEWAIVAVSDKAATNAGNLARGIREGTNSSYAPAGTFEAISRTVEGEHRVYARYVGA